MDRAQRRSRLQGCYVTIPTMFHDDAELSLNLAAMRRHVNFVIDGGIVTGTGVLLAGGAAGDFSTMTFEERVTVAETVVEAAAGRIPVAMGAQTTSTLELRRLAKSAERIGADFIQVSPPFYFAHSEEDFYEHILSIADINVGLIIYNTFWTSLGVSSEMVERLKEVPNVIGLKWSMPDMGNMEFEQVITRYAADFSIIDNQQRFVCSHMLGARGIEVHVCNYWPQWGAKQWRLLETQQYIEAQQQQVQVAMPFMALWQQMEKYTSGDGYLDKLCMELVGLDSSRCRPPTRDIRQKYREQTRQMLLQSGVPGVVAG